MPVEELKAFKKVSLQMNEENVVSFSVALSELKKWNDATNAWKLYSGDYTIAVGSNSADEKLNAHITIK